MVSRTGRNCCLSAKCWPGCDSYYIRRKIKREPRPEGGGSLFLYCLNISHFFFTVFPHFCLPLPCSLADAPFVGADGVGTAYSGKAFIRRFVFWLYRTSQLLNPVKNKATVDALWVCFISALGVSVRLCTAHRGRIYTYRRGLLRCSFNWIGQCEGLCRAGRATGTDSRAFFVYVLTITF